MTKLLDVLVNDSPDTAWERASLPRGIEDRIKTVDWTKRDVLIGLVQNREQLERFIRQKRYITARFDKDKLPIRYVALYEKGVGIRWYGELKYWSLEKLKDGRMVHAFNMVDWVELKPGIRMEEAGPNPTAYTNHFLLMNSVSYSELRLRSEADYRLFHELRRRVDTEILVAGSDSGATVGDMTGGTVFSAGGMRLQVEKDRIYSLSDGARKDLATVEEFRKRPGAVMKRLMRYAEIIL